mmetsp:Transcript_9523/g.20862  ORF Transcript_9523/g.20862 Transcript_9523/m.20862 type:complete len:93 (+) Transcript_9523:425-703(+)
MILPCLDEPSRKSVFRVSVLTLNKFRVLSNMPESSSKRVSDDTRLTEFMDSPKMSVYLLCIVIGEFDFVSACTNKGTPIRVFTPLKQSKLGL